MRTKQFHVREPGTQRSGPALLSIPKSKIQSPKSIFRGDFAALVFSGSIADLGELPGEPTALALYKFALPDPRLTSGVDFARIPGMPLPIWPLDRVRPTDGVCFVLGDERHPAVESLRNAGGIEHEHFVIARSLNAISPDAKLDIDLAAFVESLPAKSQIVVLGYGHQGAVIAKRLRGFFKIDSARIAIHDSNSDSQDRARSDGFATIDETHLRRKAFGVIYSPLMRHEQLATLLADAQSKGAITFDNTRRASRLQQFRHHGNCMLDGAADGALAVVNNCVMTKPHGLALSCTTMRQDRRRLAGIELPHLHGPHRYSLASPEREVDLSQFAATDPLDLSTWIELERAFISLRDRADLGFFAARDLCLQLWPEATRAVFPSEHVADLGATALERLLLGHLDAREIASTMQTPAQRATLAVAAAHYAAERSIIEIGSAFGGSAVLMAAATCMHRPPIYSIDPETSTRGIMRFAFACEGQLDRLHQLIQTSEQAIDQFASMRGNVGLLFIDGLHTQAGVKADFERYSTLIAPGGALVFHDVTPQIFSVFRFVVECVLTDPRFEAKCLVDGLLVLERRT